MSQIIRIPQQKPKGRPLKRPDTIEIAVAQVTDKYSGYPSNGLTPVRLAEIFREADAGDVLRQMELFEEMEEKDPHLFSQLQTRKNAVTGLDYEINPFGSEPMDKEIAEFVREQLGSLENFEDIETDLLDAIGKGFAVSEIIWGFDEGHVVIQDIKWRHQKRFFWDPVDDSFKVRTLEHPEGVLLPENKFILHRYKARSGHPSRAGVLRVVSWMYLFKNYDIKDWIAFCEVFGMPLRLGKYQPGASEDDKKALMQALVQIGTDAAGMVPDGTAIDFITAEKTSSIDLYEKLARFCDEQTSKAILGQTLTSDSGSGSYAQSKTHNEVRHDLTVADCKALASTLRRCVISPLVLYNFGEDRRIPYLRYDSEEAEDLEQSATVLGTLIEKTGLKVPTSYLYKKFSVPKPEAGEEIATPEPQSPQLPLMSSHIQPQLEKSDGVTGAAQEVKVASDLSLNGAQISSLIQIVQEVNAEKISRASALEIITSSFPFDKSKAEAILGTPITALSRDIPLKDVEEPSDTQQRVDSLADAAIRKSSGAWDKLFAPVLELVEKSGSLDELRQRFDDSEFVTQLASKMNIADIEELLQRAMLFADLEGRSIENG